MFASSLQLVPIDPSPPAARRLDDRVLRFKRNKGRERGISIFQSCFRGRTHVALQKVPHAVCDAAFT